MATSIIASGFVELEVKGIIFVIDGFKKSRQAGTFTISSDKEVYGELTLAGGNTSLYLRDKDKFDAHNIPYQCVKGVLHDLRKVTLLGCITTSGKGRFRRGEESYHYAKMFPHYVVYGSRHITPVEKKITAVHFVVDDATTLFYDFDAFGSLRDARPFIEQIIHANDLGREIVTGPYPEIVYFTGKREIFAAHSVFGRISASHAPSLTLDSPRNVGLENTIFVTIAFREAFTFSDMIDSTATLLRYLGTLVGRQQNLLELNIEVASDDKQSDVLKVYWSLPPRRDPSDKKAEPHPMDLLVDAVRDPAAFSRILANWLEREQIWSDARKRFFNSFRQQHYNVDRLIGSANMFDILPDAAVPPDTLVSEELRHARDECRNIIKKLPRSPERDSILSALGRVGKSSLKNKIRHRGKLLIDAMGDWLPDLFTVTDEAVNCRNHYVHGSEPTFDYGKRFDMFVFFTLTLEFVFAASDLIEAGWDINAWRHGQHPFGEYCGTYLDNLDKLKVLIGQSAI